MQSGKSDLKNYREPGELPYVRLPIHHLFTDSKMRDVSSTKGQFRGNPFLGVEVIADHETRTPSRQYPAPFSDDEYRGRLTRVRKTRSSIGIDLLWTGWPDAMLYLHGYEVTWYRPNRNPKAGTAVHVDHDKQPGVTERQRLFRCGCHRAMFHLRSN